MKRTVLLSSLLLACLTAGVPVRGQSKTGSDATQKCPLSITGVWRLESTSEANPIFFSVQPNGWIRLVVPFAGELPEDLEVVAEVMYKLDNPATPKQIEFTSSYDNGFFRKGTTIMEVTEYGDDTVTMVNTDSGQPIRWNRVQTHRYFLTFAASSRLTDDHAAFAMWTTLDGHQTKIEALGIRFTRDHNGGLVPVFGPIPSPLYDQFTHENGKDSDVLLRIELTAPEFERTHQVFEAWERNTRNAALSHENPYLKEIEFLKGVTESLNLCAKKVKLPQLDSFRSGGTISGADLSSRLFALIKLMRRENEQLHVTDGMFPDWKGLQLPSGQ